MGPDAVTPETLTAVTLDLFVWGQALLTSLLRPWNAYQLLIALGVFGTAHLLASFIKPRMHEWMRGREGWPKWRMRVLVVFHRRLRMVSFVILIWLVVLVMREITWPSRSYLLSIIANLATAWLLIAFATRLIKNALMRSIVRYGAWIWVTLSITGLADKTQNLLDSVAVTMGETRLSLWLVLQAIVIVATLLTLARMVV